jgi:hypothetical protein
MVALPDMREAAQQAVERQIATHASALVANEMLFAIAVSNLFRCSFQVAKVLPLAAVHERCVKRIHTETHRRHHRSYDYCGHLAALQLKRAVEAKGVLAASQPDPVDLRAL